MVSPHSTLASSLVVTGAGSALPGRELPGVALDNVELSRLSRLACQMVRERGGPELEPSDAEFPDQRIGIRSRGVLDANCSVRDLAVTSARQAIADASVDLEQVAAVIVGTVTPDRVVPSVASTVHHQLGLPARAAAFDISLGCSGFLACLEVASSMLASRSDEARVLVVGADTMVRVLDASDRTTATIFGDAGAAWVVGRGERSAASTEFVTLGEFGSNIEIAAEPGDAPLLRYVARCGRVVVEEDRRSRQRVVMNGRRVFRDMVRILPEVIGEFLDRSGPVDAIAFHQANKKMIDAVVRSLDVDAHVLSNIDRVGNTTNASIPLLLHDAGKSGRVRGGDRVLLVGFGTGYSIGLTTIEWT